MDKIEIKFLKSKEKLTTNVIKSVDEDLWGFICKISTYEHMCIESTLQWGDSSFTVDCSAVSMHFHCISIEAKKIISLWGKCDACKVSSHCYWIGKLAVQGTQIINATYWLS